MNIRANPVSDTAAGPTKTLCPQCGHKGTFEVLGKDLMLNNEFVCGQRRCPDPQCHAHIFVVQKGRGLLVQYPPTRIPFKKDNIPTAILNTFDEAISSHSQGCYVAAAIMIRRTLEEICEDRGATGKNLKDRIADLKSKVLLPHELLDAMDEMRLLGNDAAHIEARTFAQIEKAELDVAIEFTIELLKALYQYSSLLDKMRALKKP